MKSKTIIFFVIFLAAAVFFVIRFMNLPDKDEFTFYPMGGIPCKVVEYDQSSEKFTDDTQLIEARVGALENIFSNYKKESEVSKLNRSAWNRWHAVSEDMYNLLKRSLAWYGKSGGAFDITVAPLIQLWKSAGILNKLPTDGEIDSVLKEVGSDNLVISLEKGLKFLKKDMELDFGGIAKGYILDQMGRFIEGRGVDKYVVSCGGDVVMKGKEVFRVGIQEPGGSPDDLMMVFKSPPGGVVTSGHYERFVTINGKKYSHIIDPSTGWPVDNDLVSITVWSGNATDADALATAIAVLGLEKSIDLLQKLDGYEAVLLAREGDGYKVYYSEALSDKIEYKGKWAGVPTIKF